MAKYCVGCRKKKPIHSIGWRFVEKEESLSRTAGQVGLALVTGVQYRRGWWACKDCYKRL